MKTFGKFNYLNIYVINNFTSLLYLLSTEGRLLKNLLKRKLLHSFDWIGFKKKGELKKILMIFKILSFIGMLSSRMSTTLTSFSWTVKTMQNLKQTTGSNGPLSRIALKVDTTLLQWQRSLLRKKIEKREIGRWRNYYCKRVNTKKLKLTRRNSIAS
jgi:hypothetical protein